MRNVSRRNPDLSVASFVLHILLYAHPSISDKKKENNKHGVFTFEKMNIACKAMLTLKHCIIVLQTLHCTDDSILCFKPLTRGVFCRGKVNKHCLQCNKPRLTKEKKAYLFLRIIVVVVCVATVTVI
jgi:hypothetical protein